MSVNGSSNGYQRISDAKITIRPREKCYGILAKREAALIDHSEFIRDKVADFAMQLHLQGVDLNLASKESWNNFRKKMLSFIQTKDAGYLFKVFKTTLAHVSSIDLDDMVEHPEKFINSAHETIYISRNPLIKSPRIVALKKAINHGLQEAVRGEMDAIMGEANPIMADCCAIA